MEHPPQYRTTKSGDWSLRTSCSDSMQGNVGLSGIGESDER